MVENASESPDVAWTAYCLILEEFGCHVVECPAALPELVLLFGDYDSADAEICNLQLAILREEDVIRFEVQVEDVFLMSELQTF